MKKNFMEEFKEVAIKIPNLCQEKLVFYVADFLSLIQEEDLEPKIL